jgi:hypothetical protein
MKEIQDRRFPGRNQNPATAEYDEKMTSTLPRSCRRRRRRRRRHHHHQSCFKTKLPSDRTFHSSM